MNSTVWKWRSNKRSQLPYGGIHISSIVIKKGKRIGSSMKKKNRQFQFNSLEEYNEFCEQRDRYQMINACWYSEVNENTRRKELILNQYFIKEHSTYNNETTSNTTNSGTSQGITGSTLLPDPNSREYSQNAGRVPGYRN